MKRKRTLQEKILILGVLFAMIFFVVTYLSFFRPLLLRGSQISTHARASGLWKLLISYREKHGAYPLVLSDLVEVSAKESLELKDSWGNPLYFESDGTYFILVSYGRDGKPDGTDYHALRLEGEHPPGWDIKGQWNADLVYSDMGWHRLAGK